ncbi:hypothetical protein C8Q74DRAFT_1221185 [Fomes fomentarius]|nr:hypothetical protein C8Q74DRAFT_1221185 [Fomes fomentarius]
MTSEQFSYCLNSSGHREPSFGQGARGSHGSGRPGQVAVLASSPQRYILPTYDSDGRLCVAVHKSHIHPSPHQDFVYVSVHGLPSGQAFNTNTESHSGSSVPSPDTLVGKNDSAKLRSSRAKVACTNCRSAGKKCSDARPCDRCCKLNIHHSCCNDIVSVKGRKRMRNKQQDVTAMEASSQLSADNLGPPAWTPAQVATGENEQHAHASLYLFGNMWHSQEPSASSHMAPTWDHTPSQNGLTVSDLVGSWEAPAAGMSGYFATPVTSNFNQAEAYQTASQQSFASDTANLSFNIHGQGPTFL